MCFSNDKAEIMAFIYAAISPGEGGEDHIECLSRVTKAIGENYLDDRGRYLFENSMMDADLAKAFSLLSIICNKKERLCLNCPISKYCNTYIEEARNKVSADALKMVDLFCGAGGLSLGFTQEGFITVLANDIEECCIDTYAHNHPQTPRNHIVLGDIEDVVSDLTNLLGGEKIDVVVGGPPCQGFSMANRQRLINDPRNQLYKNFVAVVQTVQPPFFVMENVKGMLSVSEEVKEDFKNIGYDVECRVLNAKDFGVPQNRERLIFIGNRLKIDNNIIFDEIFKACQQMPKYVLKDALYGLKPLEASRIKNATEDGSRESGYKIENNEERLENDYIAQINHNQVIPVVLNHKARYNNDRDIEIFGRLNPGDRSDDPKITDIMPYARRNDIFKDKYFKLDGDKICKTITAHMKFDCNMYIHPTQARGLTPREAARVQSYPDDYFFRGPYTKTYMQIGNSVPPLMGRTIAHIIKKYMKGGSDV